MNELTFVTGNPKKAEYFSKCIGFPLQHRAIDLVEIQSLDIREVTTHKLEQAYEKLQKPLIVEDLALEFEALHGLPGTFIKFFLQTMPMQDICDLLKGKSRKAIVRSVIGYRDNENTKLFEHVSHGTISEVPRGNGGFGWDAFYIPDGYSLTRAEMNKDDDEETYKSLKPFNELADFLKTVQKVDNQGDMCIKDRIVD
jgi:non-canonical purine NTP pyrophosphatase (RdgB/HAM1 family)